MQPAMPMELRSDLAGASISLISIAKAMIQFQPGTRVQTTRCSRPSCMRFPLPEGAPSMAAMPGWEAMSVSSNSRLRSATTTPLGVRMNGAPVFPMRMASM